MKLAIIGSRGYTNYDEMCSVLITHFSDLDYDMGYVCKFDEIVSGGASGADSLAAKFAKEHNIKLTEHIPDWEKHGKSAGMIRNKDIIENSDFILAFWDGTSPGSKNSLNLAKKLKKRTMIVYF